jgi:uncharacterized protein Smg (DUF494 family)
MCVCVDILTFNKEKKNYYYFSIYIEKNTKQDSQKCRYIMPFNIYIYILNTEQKKFIIIFSICT